MKVPGAVRFISIFYLIEGILAILLAALIFLGGAALSIAIPILGPIVMVIGFVMALVGVFNLVVSRSLKNGRNWARIYAIIISIFAVFGAFIGGGMIILTLVHGLILYFLLFNEETKRYFK